MLGPLKAEPAVLSEMLRSPDADVNEYECPGTMRQTVTNK